MEHDRAPQGHTDGRAQLADKEVQDHGHDLMKVQDVWDQGYVREREQNPNESENGVANVLALLAFFPGHALHAAAEHELEASQGEEHVPDGGIKRPCDIVGRPKDVDDWGRLQEHLGGPNAVVLATELWVLLHLLRLARVQHPSRRIEDRVVVSRAAINVTIEANLAQGHVARQS